MRHSIKSILPFCVLHSAFFIAPGLPAGDTIDVSGFEDSAQHFREVIQPERAIQMLPGQKHYEPGQIREIAGNILLYQHDNGGWPKDYDMLAVLTAEQRDAVLARRRAKSSTFDNNSTHTQVAYLAKAHCLTGDTAFRDACVRGINYILSAQYPAGGWPQSWPDPKGYAPRITFNDGVMVGNLRVLRHIMNRASGFLWVDDALREQARKAYEKGEACLLDAQIRAPGGKLTGWAQQYNEHTLKPAQARKFEYPGTSGEDTPEVMQYLMEIENPGPRIIAAVRAAAAWLDAVKFAGIRVEEFKVPYYETVRHKGDFDRRVVNDPAAPAIWARIYDINTGKPVFANRDGTR
ncbi:MAG: pectate lyase, partial [Opitutaceae bacterium]|nr:pectate lyase [Opitutaceae bacterium]